MGKKCKDKNRKEKKREFVVTYRGSKNLQMRES